MTSQIGPNPLVESPRRWHVLAGFMLEQGYRTFVEVGCKEGRTTGHILATVPEARVIAIDPWRPMPEQKGVPCGETYQDWNFAQIEETFWQNVGEHRNRLRMLRLMSVEAAIELSGSGPFDLVFIDAAHDYDNVVTDIRTWWPLVRRGGILAGHDYQHKFPTVHRAVADCFNLMQVGVAPDSVWFVLKEDGVDVRQ